jgi:hypothetical protein
MSTLAYLIQPSIVWKNSIQLILSSAGPRLLGFQRACDTEGPSSTYRPTLSPSDLFEDAENVKHSKVCDADGIFYAYHGPY